MFGNKWMGGSKQLWPRVVGVLCICLSLANAVPTLGELIAIGPRNEIDAKVPGQSWPVGDDWSRSYNAMMLASKLDSGDPAMQFDLGRLAFWQAYANGNSSQVKSKWLSTSEGHLMQAVSGRPTWGRAWGLLGLVYLYHRKSKKAYSAMVKAMHYEPYEGQTEPTVLAVGFALWPMLSGETKRRFLSIAKQSISTSWPSWAIVPAVMYGHANVVVTMINGNSHAEWVFKREYAKYLSGMLNENSK